MNLDHIAWCDFISDAQYQFLQKVGNLLQDIRCIRHSQSLQAFQPKI